MCVPGCGAGPSELLAASAGGEVVVAPLMGSREDYAKAQSNHVLLETSGPTGRLI